MKRVVPYWLSLVKGEKIGTLACCLKAVLRLGSWLYVLVIRAWDLGYRKKFFAVHVLPRKVISVGNITLGGSGKTPLVEFLAQWCMIQGFRPGILIRGYGSQEGVSDEAGLLNKNIPGSAVIVGKNRLEKARQALQKEKIDIFILDDGLQHRKIHRDLEIVTIDSTAPFGYDYLIPRGFLREPLSALQRADIFVLTKVDFARDRVGWISSRLKKINPCALIVESTHEPQSLIHLREANANVPLSFLEDKKVCAFSAIGSPEAFRQVLVNLGAGVANEFIFRDHHVYRSEDIARINEHCRENNISIIVTTQKDAIKLKPFLECFEKTLIVLVLEIKIQIVNGRKDLEDRISRVLGC